MTFSQILNYFIALCLFRAGPADAPPSSRLLAQTLGGYIGVGWLVALIQLEMVQGLLSSLVDVALLIGMTGGLLAVRGYSGRLQQTMIALGGAGIILGALALPLLLSLHAAQQTNLPPPGLVPLLLLGLMLWSLAITAHIMRQALSASFTVGVLVAVIYALISIKVMNFLFPPI
jgi:hypothetical protein